MVQNGSIKYKEHQANSTLGSRTKQTKMQVLYHDRNQIVTLVQIARFVPLPAQWHDFHDSVAVCQPTSQWTQQAVATLTSIS